MLPGCDARMASSPSARSGLRRSPARREGRLTGSGETGNQVPSSRVDQVGDIARRRPSTAARRADRSPARWERPRPSVRSVSLAALRQRRRRGAPRPRGPNRSSVCRRSAAGRHDTASSPQAAVETGLDLSGLAHEQAQEFRLEALVAEGLPGQMDEIDRALSARRSRARAVAAGETDRGSVFKADDLIR